MKYYFFGLATLLIVCVGCVGDGQQFFERDEYVAPPAPMLQHPGPMVDGPGPGVLPPMLPPVAPNDVADAMPQTAQIRFVGPAGMTIGWKIAPHQYAENQIVVPGRYDFPQAATYRLKLSRIPGRPGLVLYPTMQVYPNLPPTAAYLAHNSVPLELTEEDLDQVESNNFVTKVIYLPDPQFQDQAIAGLDTLVSTRLDAGVDPVAEADRRGTLMVVLRVGNMDLEMPDQMGQVIDTPPLDLPEDELDELDGDPTTDATSNGAIQQVGHRTAPRRMAPVDGHHDQYMPPTPISIMEDGFPAIPAAQMVAGNTLPGQPVNYPVAGRAGLPAWGQPYTMTPIGLVGPPHIPLGGPAGLRSHTVRNTSRNDLPGPVDHMLIDVEHSPGYRMPEPVRYVQYKETHPTFSEGELSWPAWSMPQAPIGPQQAMDWNAQIQTHQMMQMNRAAITPPPYGGAPYGPPPGYGPYGPAPSGPYGN